MTSAQSPPVPPPHRWLVLRELSRKAREREADPRREEGLQAVRATLAGILDGPPEFTDLTVAEDWTP